MIEHVPALMTRIAPLTTVQIEEVVETNVTGYELAALLVASKACGILLLVIAFGWVKVMV